MIDEDEIRRKFQDALAGLMAKGQRIPMELTGPMFPLTESYQRFRADVLAQDVFAPHDILTGKATT